jgi:hypothetical protein
MLALWALPARAEEPPPAGLPPESWIMLGLGWGETMPLTQGFPVGLGVQGITTGPIISDLIRQISIHRLLNERFRVDIDHDSSRLAEGQLFGGANTYSLAWVGDEFSALKELSVGNLKRSVPGSLFIRMDAGTSESFAAHASAAAGPVKLDALARYGASLEGKRRFSGTRERFEIDLPEVGYVRARFFLLPDAGIDASSLRLARSSSTGELLIDGRPFALLQPGVDYRFDNAAGRITLDRSLSPLEELCVSYTKAGLPAGSAGLGTGAIIDAAGSRQDFTRGAFPGYFAPPVDGDWLFLRRQGISSYWEMRNAFALEDLGEGRVPEQLTVRILRTGTLAPNEEYADLEGSHSIDAASGVVLFEFTDAGGVHPRPFPGEKPFRPPLTPANNPYDPANPIYGGLSYPPSTASITTVRLSYLLSTDIYSLGAGVVEASVRVTVDGVLLASGSYSVDSAAGTISFAPGTVGPESDVEVTYRYAPLAGTGRGFTAALSAEAAGDRWGARNLLAMEIPVLETPAPRLGEERPGRIADSLEGSMLLGARPGETGATLLARAAGALGLEVPNPGGFTIVEDMEDDRRYAVGLSDSAWTIGSKSVLLPALPTPVNLGARGDILYENYWQTVLLGTEVLHGLSWDNSANTHFTYAEKAGPYNAAEEAPGGSPGGTPLGTEQSLVVDAAFPALSADAWASVTAVLPGADLSNTDTLRMTLRGSGVIGDSLLVYVEALDRYNEDINANAVLDGEGSAADPGYPITPAGGGSTRLGSDRRGQSNARLDSEDTNANGSLDTAESGVVISPVGGPSPVASIAPGAEGWTEVSVDITALVRDNPRIFEDVRAIRITLRPSTGSPAVPVSGKVVINGLWFASSPMTRTPGLLAQEVTAEEDTVVRDHPLSAAYPSLYRSLHGSTAYRAENELTEKSLAVSVAAPIAAGSSESVTRTFVPLADFRSSRRFRLYLFRRDADWTIPADARFEVSLSGGGTEKLAVQLDPALFETGWNELSILLESPWTVTVGGAAAGTLAASGGASEGMLARLASASFAVTAGPSGVPAGFRFWLDEWHLAETRLRLDTAVRAELRGGWQGTLLSAGSFPLLADPLASVSYEHRQGGFLDPSDRNRDEARGSAEAVLARWLKASATAARAVQRLTDADASVPTALRSDTTDRYGGRLALDLGVPWLPVIEHRWERATVDTRDPSVTPTGSVVIGEGADDESMTLAERMGGTEGLRQSWTYTRTWSSDTRSTWRLSDGQLLASTAGAALADSHAAEIGFRWQGGEASAEFTRAASYLSGSAPAREGVFASWARRAGLLFASPGAALPGARKEALQDRLLVSASIPPTGRVGLNAAWTAEYGELNVDPVTAARDVACRDVLSLIVPFSPGPSRGLVLTPELSVSFVGSYRQASAALGEARLLFSPYPALLLVPVAWLNPSGWGRAEAHAAADSLAAEPGIMSASNAVAAGASVAAQLAAQPWYLPSRGKAALRDETGRQGDIRSQKRVVSFSLGKEATLAAAPVRGLLGADAEASWSWDYALKVRSLDLSGRMSLGLDLGQAGDLQLDSSLSWARDRQCLGDPGLQLFPGRADGPGAVAVRPDTDLVNGSLGIQYTWSREAGARAQAVIHTERLLLETILSRTSSAASVSSVPLRGLFRHSSEIEVTDSVTLGFSGKAAAGLEKRTRGASELLLPSLGFELGVTARFRF